MKIQGRVGDVGKPGLVAGVLVSVVVGEDTTTTTTDANGYYTLDELAAQATYTVTCSKKGFYSDVAVVKPLNHDHEFINHNLKLMPRVLSVAEILSDFTFSDATDESSITISVDHTFTDVEPEVAIMATLVYDTTTTSVSLVVRYLSDLESLGYDPKMLIDYMYELLLAAIAQYAVDTAPPV